jgi:hypothetical protein
MSDVSKQQAEKEAGTPERLTLDLVFCLSILPIFASARIRILKDFVLSQPNS